MTPNDYLAKALRAHTAACVLLDKGDIEGACNRAYYAMFSAAHAALLAAGVTITEAMPKKYSGLISTFGLHLVKTNRIAANFGSALNKVERLRRLADYTGEPISPEDAAWAVECAESFILVVQQKFVLKSDSD